MQAKKVLIVDDNDVTRHLLRGLLAREDFQIEGEAASGETALKQMKKCRPDVVCLDIVLPNMSGIETLKAIKAQYPNAVVVMISGASTLDTVKEALENGADGFVVKPFNAAKVTGAVRAALQKTGARPSRGDENLAA